jgi:hypothetical protein
LFATRSVHFSREPVSCELLSIPVAALEQFVACMIVR